MVKKMISLKKGFHEIEKLKISGADNNERQLLSLKQYAIQLNEYDTAPYFIQFSQNLKFDCLLIFLAFTGAEPKFFLF